VRRVRPALVEAGQLEEIVDERAETLVLGEQPCREVGPVRVIRVAERTSRSVRIVATGLRSSWDASDTNSRWRADAASSRSSISFIVSASRRTSSRPAGTGTRRCIVVPLIDSTSVRIASTGRSARPAITQASAPTRSVRNAVSNHRPLPSSSADRCALSSGLATATVSGPSDVLTRWVNNTTSPTGVAISSPDADVEVETSKPGGTNALP